MHFEINQIIYTIRGQQIIKATVEDYDEYTHIVYIKNKKREVFWNYNCNCFSNLEEAVLVLKKTLQKQKVKNAKGKKKHVHIDSHSFL